MKLQPKFNNQQTTTLVRLHASHITFQKYLDKLAIAHDDLTTLDLLLAVRKVNITCLNRCSDLISRNPLKLSPSKEIIDAVDIRFVENDMTLWNLHGQLARLMPVYAAALRIKTLDKMTRMMVGLNYEELISVKENLLHPLPALELA